MLSSESSLAATPLALERLEGSEVKGQQKPEVRRLDQCFLLKRKRQSTEEEAEDAGRNDDHKRAKSGELLKGAATVLETFVSYLLSHTLSV